jgi:hypothetical protein
MGCFWEETVEKILLVLIIISSLMLPGCINTSPIRIEVPELVTSDRFAGYELITAEGYPLGWATESILQVEKGQIQYVIFSLKDPSIFGKPAMIGLSGELVPVPWALLTCDTQARTCGLDANRQTLELAPRIKWPSRVFDRDLEQMMAAYWSELAPSPQSLRDTGGPLLEQHADLRLRWLLGDR